MLDKEEIEEIKNKAKTCLECCKSSCYQCREHYISKEETYEIICKLEQLENKVKEQEAEKQDLIKILKEGISKLNTYKNIHQLSQKGVGATEYAQEILSKLKGEKEWTIK